MKFGIRKPSFKKKISSRLSWKRYVRHSVGLKAPRGFGLLTNPKRSVYNFTYNRTSVSLVRLLTGGRKGKIEDLWQVFFLVLIGAFIIAHWKYIAISIIVLTIIIMVVRYNLPSRRIGRQIQKVKDMANNGKINEAIESMNVLDIDKNSIQINDLYGDLYLKLNEFSKAIRHYQNVLLHDDCNDDIRYETANKLCSAYLMNNNVREADDLFKNIVGRKRILNGFMINMGFSLGQYYFKNRQYSEAKKKIEKIIKSRLKTGHYSFTIINFEEIRQKSLYIYSHIWMKP